MTTNRQRSVGILVGVCFIVVLNVIALCTFACDHKGASSSVGACYTPEKGEGTCGSATTEEWCSAEGRFWTALEINETFPTGCIDKTNYNCNEPLRNCYQGVDCEWVDGACSVVAGSQGGANQEEKKKTSVKCNQP